MRSGERAARTTRPAWQDPLSSGASAWSCALSRELHRWRRPCPPSMLGYRRQPLAGADQVARSSRRMI
jgi:hypothetical protein